MLPVLITDLTSIASKPRTTDELTDNHGSTYAFAVTNNSGFSGSIFGARYEYLTDSAYSRMTGTIYVPEGQTSHGYSALFIKGDGHILYASPAMTKTSDPVEINVNISGVKNLVIEWTNNAGYSNFSSLTCCVASPYLYPSIEMEPQIDIHKLPVDITDFKSLYSDLHFDNRFRDNYGNEYNRALYNRVDNLHGNVIPVYEFLINSNYSRFCGTLYVPEGMSFSGEISMIVYADGTLIYESPKMTKISGPVKINIDISGANDLKITFSDYYRPLCLANPCLYESDPVQYDAAGVFLGFGDSGTFDFNWGWSMFDRSAMDGYSYNRDMALAAGYLSDGTYYGQSEAERRMRALGFGDSESEYYNPVFEANTSPITAASAVIPFDGEDHLIVAVAVRGTDDAGDWLTDLRSGAFNVDGFSEAGETGMNFVRAYCSERQSLYGIDAEHTVLFVTGHSLGAAVAGQIAGNLENELAPRKNIFAYTFASPFYETYGKTVGEYVNIHNFVNTEDAVPKFPLGGVRYGIDHTFTGAGTSMLDQHMLYTYLDALKRGI
jgi:hypothetical protein